MANLFAYGTLLVPEIWRAVVGRDFPSRPAILRGFEIRRVTGADFPGIQPSDNPESEVAGRVFIDLDDDALRRLDAYEDSLYDRLDLTLLDESSHPVRSWVYVVAEDQRNCLSADSWSLDWFLAEAADGYIARLRAVSPLD